MIYPSNQFSSPTTVPRSHSKGKNKCSISQIIMSVVFILLLAAAILLPFIFIKRFLISTTTVNYSTSTTTVTTDTTTTTTAGTTVCVTTSITTGTTLNPLPVQCYNYTTITDGTRNSGYSVANYTCDASGPMTSSGLWFRFSGAAGTILANCAVPTYRCSTHATGWYSGVYPSIPGNTASGNVCYHWSGNTCSWSNSVSITNCNGYFVFFLIAPPACSLRYCTV